jgi:hypothetical protein
MPKKHINANMAFKVSGRFESKAGMDFCGE